MDKIMEEYKIDRLQCFIARYEELQKHGIVAKRDLTIEEKDMVAMLIIDFCCITSQNLNDGSYWRNADIDKFVETHSALHTQLKTIRDNFIAHLDHSKYKQEKVYIQSKARMVSSSYELKEFYIFCKQLVAQNAKSDCSPLEK
nr:MAG TPA: hypothetical protein [Caudoviricetes sp.]